MSNALNRPYADYFPFGVSLRVPSMAYAADVVLSGPYCARWAAPLALSASGLLLAGQMVNGSAFSVTTFTAGVGTATAIGNNGLVPVDSLTVRSYWGRNLTVVASAANARVLTVTGYDYLGSKMVEAITINGTTTVQGLKAFAWIESISISSDTDVTTVNIGWGNKFGLPYAGSALTTEIKNDVIAANAGTFTGALLDATTATATNADVRGTYLPLTVIPDGTNNFEIYYMPRRMNLHGNAQFTS